jgi:hypothetical protein
VSSRLFLVCCRIGGMERSTAFICQLVGKSSGVACMMSWRMSLVNVMGGRSHVSHAAHVYRSHHAQTSHRGPQNGLEMISASHFTSRFCRSPHEVDNAREGLYPSKFEGSNAGRELRPREVSSRDR